jgi:hypothetical protein
MKDQMNFNALCKNIKKTPIIYLDDEKIQRTPQILE